MRNECFVVTDEWLTALKLLTPKELLKLYRSQIEYVDPECLIKLTEDALLGRFK